MYLEAFFIKLYYNFYKKKEKKINIQLKKTIHETIHGASKQKKTLTCQIIEGCLLGRVFSLTNCDKSKSI